MTYIREAALPGQATRRPRSRKPFLIIAAIVVALLIALVGLAIIGAANRSVDVWLVNGLNREYTVHINGAPHALTPNAVRKISVKRGSVTIETGFEGDAAETVDIKPSLVHSTVYVINPDRGAVLERTQDVYSESRITAEEAGVAPPLYIGGELFHEVRGIDYAFVRSPMQIDLNSNQRMVFRDSLAVYEDHPIGLAIVLDPIPPVPFLARRARLDPTNVEDIRALLAFSDSPDEFTTIAQPHLDARPVLVEWHRGYQDAWQGSDSDLTTTYTALRDELPDDGLAVYLLGRTLGLDASTAHFEKAESLTSSAYPSAALAFNALVTGDFDAAATAIEEADRRAQASGSSGEAELVAQLQPEILHATNQFGALLRLNAVEQREAPGSYGHTSFEVYLHTRLGDEEGARNAITQLRRTLRNFEYPTEEIEDYAFFLDLERVIASGDIEGLRAKVTERPDIGYTSDLALLAGDVASASDEVLSTEEPAHQEHYILYAAAMLNNDPERAQRHAAALREFYGDEEHAYSSIMQWMNGTTPEAREVMALEFMPSEKCVILTAIGAGHPTLRTPLWDLARTLNYDRRWPHLSIRHLIGE